MPGGTHPGSQNRKASTRRKGQQICYPIPVKQVSGSATRITARTVSKSH
ncbi:MAG: hypothetical protein LUE98_04625 [Tannerellaceae bacterium]|nr:hypothetical protein [Tannerellaceae bacterium]